MTDGELLAYMGTDATKWAAEFCKIARDKGHDLDEGWVFGWFANAIETARDVGRPERQHIRRSVGCACMPRSPKDSLDRVVTSAPLDSVAARVTGVGEHYEPDVNYANHYHSDLPIATIPLGELNGRRKEFSEGLIGAKLGRLTVIGISTVQNPRKKTNWVVRCDCGHYEHRKHRGLMDPAFAESDGAMCRNCFHVELIKRRYARRGARPLEDFT